MGHQLFRGGYRAGKANLNRALQRERLRRIIAQIDDSGIAPPPEGVYVPDDHPRPVLFRADGTALIRKIGFRG